MTIGDGAPSARRRAVKNLFTLFLAFALLLGGIVIIFYYIDVVFERTILENNELKRVKLQKKTIAGDFDSVVSDLMILSQLHSLGDLFESKANSVKQDRALKEIAESFLIFSTQKRLYDQIRFIDDEGLEIVRVNYNNGNPALVPGEKLQIKSHRYYFKETMALDEGLFVSPFDLNIERGKVEEPIKPMIRFGTPVFDSDGRKRGILLLNYLGRKLLSNLKITSTIGVSEPMLLNAEGYWLLNSNPDNEWGFMWEEKKDRRFANRYPESWREISKTESGQYHDEDGLVTYATVYPLLHGSNSTNRNPTSGKLKLQKSYYWKILSRIPHSAMHTASRSIGVKMLFLYLAVIGVLGVGVWALDRPVIHKEAMPAQKTSPLFLFFVTASAIFVAEIFIMLILSILQVESSVLEALLDGFLLVLFVSPFLYVYLFRPLILHISERKHAQDALLESEERFRRLSEASFEGVIIHDRGMIIEANQEYADTFGYELSELYGKSILDLVASESAEVVERHFLTGHDRHYEAVGLRKDGSTFPVELVGKDAKYKGRTVRIAAVRNITQRKKAEDELRVAKEQAEEATMLKDKFVSLVSHDLKNPIAGMAGFLKLLNDEVEQVITDKGRKMMGLARKNLFKMTEMIDGLLNVSRLKTGQFKPEQKFIDAYRLSMKTVVDLGEMAREKGVSLVNKIPKRSRMYADFTLLYEVIQNLVTNSIKFCNKGDTITIFIPAGTKTTIAVADTGVGIEKERLDKLFDYEEKTSTPGTAGETGTGLGLPLARDIVEAHNGKIRVESAPDKETTFYVDLPFVKPKILLFGEKPKTGREINEILSNLDMELLTVKNSSEGQALLNTVTPDLILLNVEKTEHYGFEFLKYLKNSEEYNRIPVVAITSHGEYKNQERALELGADDFITDPTSPDELIPRVRRHTH